jgi:signal transduction histidine kinase
VRAQASHGQVFVTWSAPPVGAAAIDSYTVVSEPKTKSTTTPAAQTAVLLSGLPDGTTFRFAVYASNSAGPGPRSAQTEPVTTPSRFTVDTHIFRELGELLVGRDSTALVELIKNAYDADASEVTVHGERLSDGTDGKLIVADNGIGMSPEQFRAGFLRVASRLKDDGDRRSPVYGRRYTGAKGIGRLAAHKLATRLRVDSVPNPKVIRNASGGVYADIDWHVLETRSTLDDLDGTNAIVVKTQPLSSRTTPGTTITLEHPRKRWSQADLVHFFSEVQSFRAPVEIVDLDSRLIPYDMLFKRPHLADSRTRDPGFVIAFSGDLEAGDDYWSDVAHNAHWLVEVEASKTEGLVRYKIGPTMRGQEAFGEYRPQIFTLKHPDPSQGPFFHSRLLIREGGEGTREEKMWLGSASGVRVFMEGFRVLPYGEPKDDWLSIDADYVKRGKTLSFLRDIGLPNSVEDPNEALVFLRNRSYFGGVFLTQNNAPTLRMLVNREGFIPDEGYKHLVTLMRAAIHLSVRVRASAKTLPRERRTKERKDKTIRDAADRQISPSGSALFRERTQRLAENAHAARQLLASGDVPGAQNTIAAVESELAHLASLSNEPAGAEQMIRVLASVGTQMAAFVHEVHGLLGTAVSLEQAMNALRADRSVGATVRHRLSEIVGAIGDLRRTVERQASYLTDVTSPDARRRRSRQLLSDRLDAGARLIRPSAEKRLITIVNDIPRALKSPPMFPAELTLIFSNLLTNAVKAAGNGGRIWAHAVPRDDGTLLRVENTGIKVDLREAERWFLPFESTTVTADPILGQGMGMGLPLTRQMLEQYGSSIRFAEPSRGFKTAVEVFLKET